MKQFEWNEETVKQLLEMAISNRFGLVANTPEFLIEIFKQSKQPKPDWEIVAVGGYWNDKDTSLGVYEKKIIDGKIAYYNDLFDGFDNMEYIFNSMRGIIYSVKRLSDGEIFSVGEVIDTPQDGTNKIIAFHVTGERMNVKLNNGTIGLEHIQKAKQPLFTTEDGVPVYEGGEIFVCDSEFKVGIVIISEISYPHKKKLYKFFSTHSAANEYALANKPQLSLSDVEQAYVGDKKSKEYISLIDNLRLIIRQKK